MEIGQISYIEFYSDYGHYRASGVIANYEGSPFAMGDETHAKTEILTKETLEWYETYDYPFYNE